MNHAARVIAITLYYYRVIPDRWKGMSPSQLGEILETQQLQCEEKQVRYIHVHVHDYITCCTNCMNNLLISL